MDYIFNNGTPVGAIRPINSPDPTLQASFPAAWYRVEAAGDGLEYHFAPGMLSQYAWLSADFLLAGERLVVFVVSLQEGEHGPRFGMSFGLLTGCQARMRIPLEAVNQNRWLYPREGAWLKPTCWGERVDLARVDRMTFAIHRMSEQPAQFGMTVIKASQVEPVKLNAPLLSNGRLLDRFGQSGQRDWPTKTRSEKELTARLRAQFEAAGGQAWPQHFSRWGGWKEHPLEATGFFRTTRAEGRWWLVDPDGCPFWSAGLDCVRVDTEASYGGLESGLEWLPEKDSGEGQILSESMGAPLANYLQANFIRAFGPQAWHAAWKQVTMAELRRVGFNTVANWSDWRAASEASMPYTRPLDPVYEELPLIYRDFPDVYHPDFEKTCQRFAAQLEETRDDAAFIGYFMMNEPTWGFALLTPAEGMLFNTPECYARQALADWLATRHGSDSGLAKAWGMSVRLAEVERGAWTAPLTREALNDLEEFSGLMVERFFGGLSDACRAADPNHLNLGIRYYTVPPSWALNGMRKFDVFSMNCYRARIPADEMEKINQLLDLPILIGEWHFGALDAGLPASGIGHVTDQVGRGQAYRIYLEDAAAKPWCVGVHYFTLYDESALGRFDGENYNIGFVDVCNRPYDPLCDAARLSHERMYAVAAGSVLPYTEEPRYLPMLFL